jgi:HK97 family phage prohead protease
MSYHVAKSAKCPINSPWGVIKDGDGKVLRCHVDEASAQADMDGLQENDPAGAMTALSALLPGLSVRAWDPDGDGDDDSTPAGDTDHSHWTADGKQKKSVPGKPMPGQPPAPRAAAKPYGNVTYADPKNGKYPIDTAAHAKAAWSYINMPKNAAKYPLNGVTLSEVKGRIAAACKKFGIQTSQANAAHFAPDLDVVRSGGGLELRADAPPDGSIGVLTGRFSEFGRWYKVSSRFEGDFMERVAPGATADTIRDDTGSMRVLFDHGMDAQIGNKVLGPIGSLTERSDGPHYEVPLFDTSYNRDLLPGLKAGVYGASMRMRVTGDEWNDEPDRSDTNPDGIPERTITRMKVPEFGPVTFPANQGATAGVRSGTDEFYHRLRQVNAPAFEDAVRAAGLSLEDFTGRGSARSAPGGEQEHGVQPGNGGPSPNHRTALRDRAWRMRRQPT